jgi:hypothetical protein
MRHTRRAIWAMVFAIGTSAVGVPLLGSTDFSNSDTAIAISLGTVARIIETGEGDVVSARSLAGITTPHALIVDDSGDLILLGTRESDSRILGLDSVIIAFKNRDASEQDSPGVTIQPERNRHGFLRSGADNLAVDLKGFSVVDSTLGNLFVSIDLALKLWALGLKQAPVRSLPSEYELQLHQIKAGYRINPWIENAVNSFFYPTWIRVVTDDRSACVHSVRISVVCAGADVFARSIRDANLPQQLTSELLVLDRGKLLTAKRSEVLAYLAGNLDRKTWHRYSRRVNRLVRSERARREQELSYLKVGALGQQLRPGETASEAYARRLTEEYASLEQANSDLRTFRHFVGLYALVRAAGALNPAPDLLQRLASLPVTTDRTPRSVPNRRIGDRGLAVSLEVEGGLTIHPLIEKARAGRPSALRELTLRYRPIPEALYWTVPLEPGTPADPTAESLAALEASAAAEAVPDAISMHDKPFLSDDVEQVRRLDPVTTTGWKPTTSGSNLFETRGEFDFGAGAGFVLRPDQLYIDPPKEVFSLAYTLSSRMVLANRFELSLSAPLIYRFFQVPVSQTLPGVVDVGSAAGLSNVSISTRMLLSKGSLRRPTVLLRSMLVTPLHHTFFEDNVSTPSGSVFSPIGLDGWNLDAGPVISMPLGTRAELGAHVLMDEDHFRNGSDTEGGKRAWVYGLEPRFRLHRRWAASAGLAIERVVTPGGPSTTYELFMDHASRNRVSRSLVGVSRLPSGESYMFYNLALAPEFLFFRRSRWF